MPTIMFDNGQHYNAKNADISVLTGYFAAAVAADNSTELLLNFLTADKFYVDSFPEGRKVFTGFTVLIEFYHFDDYYCIVLAKEGDS